MLTVDDYEVMRRKLLVDKDSIRTVARELGRSRKTVRKARDHPVPPGYRRTVEPPCPVIGPVAPVIDAWLEEDKGKPRKQRHLMTRIFSRLVEEYGFSGGYDAVRRYIGRKRVETGEVYIPLVFDPGEEAQIDWGEAFWIENGIERTIMLFCMRLCHSTASFVRAYEKEDMESVLDGHVRAFAFFGGVPRRNCYDNMKTVVITVGKGRERTLTKSFRELRSHYLFDTRFCNVASGNEKGHVENLVKFSQRTFMTPMFSGTSLDDLNAFLDHACHADLDRTVKQRDGRTRRELLDEERARFLPLPATPFEACKRVSTFVSKEALVQFDNVRYSVPVCHAYQSVEVRAFTDRVEIHMAGACMATHVRQFKRGFCLDYTHYIPLLERKPGGILNGRPFKGEPWGEDLERMRRELECRYGGEGTKKFIRILLLFSKHPEAEVKEAVRTCVNRSAFSDEAVESVLRFVPRCPSRVIDLSGRPKLHLATDGRRSLTSYDHLLSRKEVSA